MNLDLLPVSGISTLTLPKRFPEALQEALIKIDAHHKEMELVYVCLFGSAARGEAEFGSDLDLLLLTNSESDVCGFNASIAPDLIILGRYGKCCISI